MKDWCDKHECHAEVCAGCLEDLQAENERLKNAIRGFLNQWNHDPSPGALEMDVEALKAALEGSNV